MSIRVVTEGEVTEHWYWNEKEVSCEEFKRLQALEDRAVDELRAQLEEALGIIADLADLHDSYITYLLVHGMYKEEEAKKIFERIQMLRLK